MGNVYSGRQAQKILVDHCYVLDVRNLRVIFEAGGGEGWLELRWGPGAVRYGFAMRGDARAAQLRLEPFDRRTGTPSEILIHGERQRFGGVRPFLICPRCGWRCLKLYQPVSLRLLACRACHGLSYPSQRVDPIRRGRAVAAHIREGWPGADRRFERQVARARRAQGPPTTAFTP